MGERTVGRRYETDTPRRASEGVTQTVSERMKFVLVQHS